MSQIKGTVLIDTVAAVRERLGEAKYGEILQKVDPTTREIFEGRIFAAEWYSLDSFTNFLEVETKLSTEGHETELIARSEKVIEKELRGIYKLFVKLGSPVFVLKRISAVHATYFKNIDIDIRMDGPQAACIRWVGFHKQHRIIGFSLIGFYKKALEISGARDVRAVFTTKIEEDKGFCELNVSWTGK